MQKKLALSLLFAAAGGAFLFGAGSSAILSPRPPEPLPQSKSVSTAHGKIAQKKGTLLQVRGKILKVYPSTKKTAEWIILLAGKKRVSILVYNSAVITDKEGATLRPAFLRAGDIVSVSYRHEGKRNTALTIKV